MRGVSLLKRMPKWLRHFDDSKNSKEKKDDGAEARRYEDKRAGLKAAAT
jgi:hypothetical protein